jgi:hypothetical protein
MMTSTTAEPRTQTDEVPTTCRHASERACRAALASHAHTRRRRINPTTCDRDYSVAEMEFMNAMQAYKSRSGRMFPTWSEVLGVFVQLGYRKSASPSGPAPLAS